jgi:hypothetical protein
MRNRDWCFSLYGFESEFWAKSFLFFFFFCFYALNKNRNDLFNKYYKKIIYNVSFNYITTTTMFFFIR